MSNGLDMTVNLRALLPAGEWANVQVLNQPTGLMANRDWALFAKAKRVRDGGKPAFIKFIVAAGSQAGSATLWVTGGGRLRDLYERLQRIRQLGRRIPVVPLLEIEHSESGLLIAMEEVTPLSEMIDRGEAYRLSAKVLEDLDPDTIGNGWHHFDVCPRNIGVLPDGRCVLIDVESLYLESEGMYNISVPAWKPFRAPNQLVLDVHGQLAAGNREIDRALAARKLRFEIALAAAECVLGPIPFKQQNQALDRSIVEAWVSSADAADPAVAFWKQELLSAIDTASVPPLQHLRQNLESAVSFSSEPAGAPLVQAPVAGTEPVQSLGTTISAITPSPAESGWSKEWALILPMVHALRAGKLGGKEIVEYRQALQEVAARYPTHADAWNELLLVVISYEKDAVLALSVVKEALKHIPGDDGLTRMKNIIQMWAGGRQHGSH
jgi:hypothetical protein